MYAWHLTFEHATALHRLAAAYQERLATLGGSNPVPLRWLHLTVQDVGYVDATPDGLVASIVEATAARLRELRPFEVTFGEPLVVEESIVVLPTPAEPIRAVADAIRRGVADAAGGGPAAGGRDQAPGFWPHVSLAYVNRDGPARPYVAKLAEVHTATATVRIAAATLIVQDRVLDPDWVYRWTVRATAPFGRPAPA
jgi:2'-5' RNA ligase